VWIQRSFHRGNTTPGGHHHRGRGSCEVYSRRASAPRAFNTYGWFSDRFGRGWLCCHLEDGATIERSQSTHMWASNRKPKMLSVQPSPDSGNRCSPAPYPQAHHHRYRCSSSDQEDGFKRAWPRPEGRNTDTADSENHARSQTRAQQMLISGSLRGSTS